MADHSLARLDGLVEDVCWCKWVHLIFCDFIILDFDAYTEVPFILGNLFLATGSSLIDVGTRQLKMRAHDKVEVVNVYKVMKLPDLYEELSSITIIDLELELPLITSKDTFEISLVGWDIFGVVETNEMVQISEFAKIFTQKSEFMPL